MGSNFYFFTNDLTYGASFYVFNPLLVPSPGHSGISVELGGVGPGELVDLEGGPAPNGRMTTYLPNLVKGSFGLFGDRADIYVGVNSVKNSTIVDKQIMASNVPDSVAIDILGNALDWAIEKFSTKEYKILSQNSNTVASAVYTYIGADLIKRGYSGSIQISNINSPQIYQPGLTDPSEFISELPDSLKLSGRKFLAEYVSTYKQEGYISTLGEVYDELIKNLERAWGDLEYLSQSRSDSDENRLNRGVMGDYGGITLPTIHVDSNSIDPIILDLDGDGIEFSGVKTALFDMDGDTFQEQSAWVASGDGFLVLDLNQEGARSPDGKITQAKELSLSLLTPANDSDLEALRNIELNWSNSGNGDGKLDASDSIWSALRVWRDSNQNGVVDPGELKPLSAWGISQISLAYDHGAFGDAQDDTRMFGSTLRGVGSMVRNGVKQAGTVGDISLSYYRNGWKVVEYESGANVQIEGGSTRGYRFLDGTGSTNWTVAADAQLYGIHGDARSNNLSASAASHAVFLIGAGGSDKLTGGAYGDVLSGGAGEDTLLGGGGSDRIYFDAADATVDGGAGSDMGIVVGSAGVDISVAATNLEVIYGGAGSDKITGVNVATMLVLYGGNGWDTLIGGAAKDLLDGGSGNDVLTGNAGDDVLQGGAGADSLVGSSGEDVLQGGAGVDTLDGGDDHDIIYADASDVIRGGPGFDLVNFSALTEAVEIEFSAASVEAVIGGSGNDTIKGSTATTLTRYANGGGGSDSISLGGAADRGLGGWGNDTISGFGGNDSLFGNFGNDVLNGDDGADVLNGSVGNDRLLGGSGTDQLSGDEGNDTLFGDGGSDTFKFTGENFGQDSISDFDLDDEIRFVNGPTGWGKISISRIVTENRLEFNPYENQFPFVVSKLVGVDLSYHGNKISLDLDRTYSKTPDAPISQSIVIEMLDDQLSFG